MRLPQGPMRGVVLWAAATFVIDQITKYVVLHLLQLDRVREIDLFYPWLQFRMAWNQGVNFGLLSNSAELARWALIALALAISFWVWRWAQRGDLGTRGLAAAGLLIGGALGNVLDRVIYGAVVDFLNMGFPGFSNPYSFNVADIAIFAGAAGLVLFAEGGGTGARTRRRGG